MKKVLLTAALTLTGLLLLTSCGAKKDSSQKSTSRSLSLMLDYFPNADHIGIYGAEAEGVFDKSGIDLEIRTPSDPAAPLKLLQSGKVDIAISYQPELLLARDKGADLVSIGAVVQQPLTSIISIGKDRVKEPKDLKGKTIATAGIPYQDAYLKTILADAGVNSDSVKTVNVGFNLTPAMLSGKADATLGSFWNYEGTELKLKGKNPSIIKMEDAGVPTYSELIVVAKRESLKKDPQLYRSFMQAFTLGQNAVKEDPNPALDQLLKANPDLKRKLQAAVVKATQPVFFPANTDKPFGYQDRKLWRTYSEWMLQQGILQNPANVAKAVTNEFLPGEGV